MGAVLHHAGIRNILLLDRHGVGASFERWPAQMRFISPSFTSNGFGLLDLNAVAIGTSPAYSLVTEHPSGKEYARYLRAVAEHFELPTASEVDVTGVRFDARTETFTVTSAGGRVDRSRFVVWAGGEFSAPNRPEFPGVELCRHNGEVRTWREIDGDRQVIIGGFESGVDAAVNLIALGRNVTVLDRGRPWDDEHHDPSRALSPYTLNRLAAAHRTKRLTFAGEVDVTGVRKTRSGFVTEAGETRFPSDAPPILATGFAWNGGPVRKLFAKRPDGFPLLNEFDESTRQPGLFLVGPSVRHESLIFCFIFKFRQRFGVVGRAIAERLGLDLEPFEFLRKNGLLLDDLSCCDAECAC
jgi:thioredoxin reductase